MKRHLSYFFFVVGLFVLFISPRQAIAYFPSDFAVPDPDTGSSFRSQRGRDKQMRPVRVYPPSRAAATVELGTQLRRLHVVFERLAGENNEIYNENETLYQSQLDLRSLVSHRCFNPVGAEQNKCKTLFGPYFNLRNSLLDGSIRTALVTNNPNVSSSISALISMTENEIRKNVQQRSFRQQVTGRTHWLRTRTMQIWEICTEKFGMQGRHECLQRNNRLMSSPNIPITVRNVY